MINYRFCICGLVLAFLVFLSLPAVCSWPDNAEWADEFYQYRIPIEVTVSSAGLQQLPVTSDTIVNAINQIEDIDYSAKYFDYNNVKLVEYDDNGSIVDSDDSGGFYISYAGPELITNGSFENETGGVAASWSWNYNGNYEVVSGQSHDGSKCLRIVSSVLEGDGGINQALSSITANTPYVFSYWCKSEITDYGTNPSLLGGVVTYLEVSYFPYLRSKYWRQYKLAVNEPNSQSVSCRISRYHVGTMYFDDISFRQARYDLLINPANTGPKKYMLYYQPTETISRVLPERWLETVPATVAAVGSVGSAQRYDSIVKYSVYSDSSCDIWFAESTQKITPAMSAPALQKSGITIESARNERQSFQLVLNPKAALTIDTASISDLSTGGDTISAANHYVKIVDYAYMSRASRHAHSYIPNMADILEAFTPRTLNAGDTATPLWFTIIVDTNVVPGIYSGTVSVEVDASTIEIPLQLKVHKFALPDRTTFRTAHGSSYWEYRATPNSTTVNEFHGCTTIADKEQLIQAYYDVMLDNRDCPYAPTSTYSPLITYEYDTPPYGLNVEYPGNYFYLHDFDFSVLDAQLNYWVNTRHANSIMIGPKYAGYHATTHRFPDYFWVGWDYPDSSIAAITQGQFDKLIIDYWQEIAFHLITNGWIDYVYILFDETRTDWPSSYGYGYGYEKMKYFCELLQTNPFTAQLKIAHTINFQSAYVWKEFPDTETDPSFKGLIDIWIPYNGEDHYNFYEPYYFTENGMDPEQEETWFY